MVPMVDLKLVCFFLMTAPPDKQHNKNIHDIGSEYRSFSVSLLTKSVFYSPEFVSALLSGAVHENANVWLSEFEH